MIDSVKHSKPWLRLFALLCGLMLYPVSARSQTATNRIITVYDMLHFEIPAELRSPRFGIAAFHHPALVALMNETKPELQLMGLIDLCGVWRADDTWSGIATQMVAALYGHEDHGSQARELVRNANRCGIYLTRLVTEVMAG